MTSSRIFIKGLPPSISEDDFKRHFSKLHTVTDVKLIPHRRIGYVGYKSPEEAAKAVKYFNKSFIRMSRIDVEIARPISDATLPVSNKAHKEQVGRTPRGEKAAEATSNAVLKRKRSDVEESDPKLKEFLEVMLPKSTPKTWATQDLREKGIGEPPRKVQALERPDAERDSEYEMIMGRSTEKNSPLAPTALSLALISNEKAEQSGSLQEDDRGAVLEPVKGASATDDEWLRSRTNRLLDLVDPIDVGVQKIQDSSKPSTAPDEPAASTNINAPAVEEGGGDRVTEDEVPLDEPDPTVEAIRTSGRLFVRNLPYSATEDDLRKHFESYGTLQEVYLPLDRNGKSKGFMLIQFEDPSAAIEAYHNIDGEPFQGRLIHVLPAATKKNKKLDEFAIAKLPLKKQQLIKKKAAASASTFNWNSLYMSQDAVNSSIADRLGVSKSELLDPTSAGAAVKQAIAETSIIQETKSYFVNNGVDLNAFKRRERGDTILVKNFPYGMSMEELRKMFEKFGQVLRVLMPPAGTIAIVEFALAPEARAAFASLAYRRIQDSVLFLEKAPKDLFTDISANDAILTERENVPSDPKPSTADFLEGGSEVAASDTSTLFVKNLNFSTTSAHLKEVFKPLDGFMSARVNTKTDPKKPGQLLSMGFGFVEFRSKAQAQAALKAMNGYNLDGHKLLIKVSNKGLDATEERRKEDKAKKLAGSRTKLVIKNLPFEASKRDVRSLFGTYGQLRSVRVPKKFDHSSRGFAFANFVTASEAENALEALKDTHLLGRRLVLDFAAEDPADAEEEIEKMQRKVGKQTSKVALQKLTGAGRKKFNIEGNRNEDDS